MYSKFFPFKDGPDSKQQEVKNQDHGQDHGHLYCGFKISFRIVTPLLHS